MEYKDYYKVLGVSRTASADERARISALATANSRRAVPLARCPDHQLEHPVDAVCPGCRSDQLAGG